ncbi:MAG: WYL domain-containing protein [Lachnospiraceae bacterium]|nr:WYL domain-containing protein [Lachnospiraceae bacterium]
MAAVENQKLKMLYLRKILSEETDQNHGLSAQELIDRLERCGVNEDRKTLYRDLDELERFGMEILRVQNGRTVLYHLNDRLFELPELKLLVDAVQSSRFISDRKSAEISAKLMNLTSDALAKSLKRRVFVASRVKSENEEILYNIDSIHRAIRENVQISFAYYEWNLKKELVLRGPEERVVSPWYLIWQDEYYYLVAYDAPAGKSKHFRVDKMRHVNLLEEKRLGSENMKDLDLGAYVNEAFSMYSGKPETVSIRFPKELIGVAIDRFGRDVAIREIEDGNAFRLRCRVDISPQFFGWLAGLGSGVRILEPQQTVEEYRAWISGILEHMKDQA